MTRYMLLVLIVMCISCRDTATNTTSNKDVVSAAMGASVEMDDESKGAISLDKDYWYAGKAEVSTYDLQQNRYNAVHDGEVVAIFVTEDFLTDKQVKNDNYNNKNSVSVLKTNLIRRFTTGLYDYSMMTSVFTRADGSGTEKVTLSSQDWCGQSYVQVNNKGSKYHLQMRSYFESEGDKDISFKADVLEDELMNLLRINPDMIPTGTVDILPSLTALRFSHKEHKAYKAMISNQDYKGDILMGESLRSLRIEYSDLNRVVEIVYESAAPYEIAGWFETSPSGFDKKDRTTVAERRSIIHEPYWEMNQMSDQRRRAPMGLGEY